MNIHLVGSATLDRFTEGILRAGLLACGCNASANCLNPEFLNPEFAIIQIHGAPAARAADLEIIRRVPELVLKFSACIILIHRPDEIRDFLPHFRAVMAGLPSTAGVVMLGDLLLEDSFYKLPQLSTRVIPHGFFDGLGAPLSEPIIIGSHTTWGEMRSIERTLRLLKEIVEKLPQRQVVGYLGGSPMEALSCVSVQAILQKLDVAQAFTLGATEGQDWRELVSNAGPNTIFISADQAPIGFETTFNVQLYHYHNQIRLGESSGSLHASAGIPVIFEMNGSDKLEELRVAKIPYAVHDDVESADLSSGAQQIVDLINSGEYLEMLIHNRLAASIWNNKKVALLYIQFLKWLLRR